MTCEFAMNNRGMEGAEMKLIAGTLISLSLFASAYAHANQGRAVSGSDAPAAASSESSQTIKITRSGSQSSRQGPAENFIGSAHIDPLFQPNAPARASGARVTFEPGARTAWHTHPLGQTLIVTAGTGWVQQEGGEKQEIKPGDVIWTPPGVKHWHGATATDRLTHIAIQESLDGKNVEWMEKVSDEQYLSVAAPASPSLRAASLAQADKGTGTPRSDALSPMLTLDDVRTVSPALERYRQGTLMGDLWKRPDLSPRDRSIVTVAALIARNQATEMPYSLNLALDNGVKPHEISEIITHLAFYSGWGNAISAVAVTKDVFARRKIGTDQLPPASPKLLPLGEAAEAQRAARVGEQFGKVVPGIVQYTTDVLFRDLWLRPDLAPRDRSLVTVSALIAAGQVAQIPYHLNRAMDNGLTQAQAAEVITHLAFYVGWPNAFSALPVAKEVFEKRPR
jgi:4-carboxymuconolactone decarboxylase